MGVEIICVQSLYANKPVMKEEVRKIYAEGKEDDEDVVEPPLVTRLIISDCGEQFFLGYEDGLVQAISSIDLSFQFSLRKGQKKENGKGYGIVNDIYADS